MGNGIYCYNPGSGKTTHYTHNDKDSTSLSSNSVSDITEASDGTLWFATDRGGICAFNKKTGKFKTYSVAQGLPDDTSYKILEDNIMKLHEIVKYLYEKETITGEEFMQILESSTNSIEEQAKANAEAAQANADA